MILTTDVMISAGGAMKFAPPVVFCAAGAMNITGEFTAPDYWCTNDGDWNGSFVTVIKNYDLKRI